MARLFDNGSTQYLRVASTPVSAAPLTLSCWFNCDEDAHLIIAGMSQAAANLEWFLLQTRAGGDVRAIARGGGAEGIAAKSGWSVNTWHHICGVFASTTSRFAYLDGSVGNENITNVTPTVDQTDIAIIRVSGPFSGSVFLPAFWNVALTGAEVDILGQGFHPLFVRPEALVFCAQLINNELIDIIGGLTLTAVNGPTVSTNPRIIWPSPQYYMTVPAVAPPAAAALPILSEQGIHSLVFGGVTVR